MSSVLGYEILGAVKVKDGLFVGDELAAQDLDFVVANKITRVINCCGRQIPNHWEPIGVAYLTYDWVDADNQIVLDRRDVVANEVFRFIEEASQGAESLLIHSVCGQSRSCCVLSAYMMKKYAWGLRKTIEFLSSRRPDLNLKPAFLQQLSGYERRLMAQSNIQLTLDWNAADLSRLEGEDLLLRNTYINSQIAPSVEFSLSNYVQVSKPKLLWSDNSLDDKVMLERPAGSDLHNFPNGKHLPDSQPVLRCILKKRKSEESGEQKTMTRLATLQRLSSSGTTCAELQQPVLDSSLRSNASSQLESAVTSPACTAIPKVLPVAFTENGDSSPTASFSEIPNCANVVRRPARGVITGASFACGYPSAAQSW